MHHRHIKKVISLILLIFCAWQGSYNRVYATGDVLSGIHTTPNEETTTNTVSTQNEPQTTTGNTSSGATAPIRTATSGTTASGNVWAIINRPDEQLTTTSTINTGSTNSGNTYTNTNHSYNTTGTTASGNIVMNINHPDEQPRSSITQQASSHILDTLKPISQIQLEEGRLKEHRKIRRQLRQGLIEVELPDQTQLTYANTGNPVIMSLDYPILVDQTPASTPIVTPLETVFRGDHSESIQFEQDGVIESVTFTLATDALQHLEVGSLVRIMTSQDGAHWKLHEYRQVVAIEGRKAVIFDTTHLTYFNIGSILGDFTINNDDITTTTGDVTLTMDISGAQSMRFGNTTAARNSASWESYTSTKSWTLSTGTGAKTVYAEFESSSGDTVTVEDMIIFQGTGAATSSSVLPVTGGLTLHFDTSVSGAITTTAFGVQQWDDQSGNGYHARQENATTNQPDLVTDATTTDDVIDFNGSDDYLSIQTLNYNAGTSLAGVLVCTVFKTSYSNASYNSNWAFLDFDRSEFFDFYVEGDGDLGFSYASSAGGITDNSGNDNLNDGQRHVGCASFDGTATNDTVITADGITIFDQNRVANGTVISDTTTRYGFIGDGSEAGSYNAGRNTIYYDGRIAELVYYEQAHTTADRQEIECYLGEKRGVAVAGCNDVTPPIATVEYTPETDTNGYVAAVLTGQSEPITVTNNGGAASYLFTGNGSFTFTFQDIAGNTGAVTATVNWILNPPTEVNEAPEITSNGGSGSISIEVASGVTYITTVTATDSDLNVIGQYGSTTLTDNTPLSIAHNEVCEPVVTVSHRQEATAESQRVPRVVAKGITGFDVKVDNYQSNLSASTTPIDWIVMASGSHTFNGVPSMIEYNKYRSV